MTRYLSTALTLVLALAVSTASAEPTAINAYENAEVQTSFTLDFPDLGIQSTSNVFYTRFEMELDDEAGTAKFLNYEQEIESLALPLGINTGRISVRILKSNGTYDAATQTFETNDDYQIAFQNDLGFFGFESPVVIPATSSGTVTGGTDNAQSVTMEWQGEGELENSDNPEEPFKFTYTCRVETVVAATKADIPAIPTRGCADGVFSLFGFVALSIAGMKVNVRRRRR